LSLDLLYLLPGAGFLLVLLIASFWRSGLSKLFTLIGAAFVGFLVWCVLLLVERLLSVQFLVQEGALAERSPWTSLVYFAAMVAGMLAQTVWDALHKRQPNQAPTFDKWEFVKPGLVAPIVFIAVYQTISDPAFKVMTLLFAFQNGFFWQTVLKSRQS
jgi:hypothetical protein